jgi:hypothetical protein
MQLTKTLMMGFGAVLLAALLLALAVPKATHTFVATLVQVANTVADPVPNKDVDNPGRANIQLAGCGAGSTAGYATCGYRKPRPI